MAGEGTRILNKMRDSKNLPYLKHTLLGAPSLGTGPPLTCLCRLHAGGEGDSFALSQVNPERSWWGPAPGRRAGARVGDGGGLRKKKRKRIMDTTKAKKKETNIRSFIRREQNILGTRTARGEKRGTEN